MEGYFKPTHTLDKLQVDSVNKLFKVKGQSADAFQKKKNNFLKTGLAFYTLGISKLVENAIDITKGKIYNFSDLHGFELLEDDYTVTSGGAGLALAATALTGRFEAGAIGGIVGKKKNKKVVETMIVKLNINDFDNPCIMIPIITKPTKTKSKEYKEAFNEAQKIISMLDLITHTS